MMTRVARYGGMLALMGLVAGCASTSEPEGPSREERLRALMDLANESAEQNPEAEESAPEAPPGMGEFPGSDVREEEPRFDINVSETPARAFFQSVVDDTPYNVIVHPEVEGTVTMSLTDVSVPEVMEAARDVYGYEYRKTDTAYQILPARQATWIYRLDYLNVVRNGSSGARVSAGELVGSGDEEGGDDDERGALGSRVNTTSRSELWADVEKAIEEMLADEEGASVMVSPDAGSVVVHAMPSSLRRVGEFIDNLQGTLTRQVALEARILEIELYDDFAAGIDWETVGTEGGRVLSGSLSSGTVGVSEADTFNLEVLDTGPNDSWSFEGLLNVLETQGEVQVLSSPEIATLNNRKAVIKAGTDAFFQTGINVDRSTVNGNRFTEITPEFEPFFSGIALDVTPNISEDGWITLHIQPSVTTVREVERTVDLGDADPLRFNMAQSDVRQSDSIVRARDSELISIGGLIEERETEETSRVPILGRIPLLGALFTHRETHTRKYELVILLRPRLVEDEQWATHVERRARSVTGRTRDGED